MQTLNEWIYTLDWFTGNLVMSERTKFAGEFRECWPCHWDGPGFMKWGKPQLICETHEIVRGPDRWKAVEYRCTWIRTCRECHEALGDYAQWPLDKQLALKYVFDRQYYDRQLVNTLRGREENAITGAEVARWVWRYATKHCPQAV